MSYDLMVFNPQKVPHELGELRQWLHTNMEKDVFLDKPPAVFHSFLENILKVFPVIDQCVEDRLEYACEYEVHEVFVYMCFGYSVAKEAHDIVKRQARIEHLGFWDVSQDYDRTFPVTTPADKWPMLVEAQWVKYGKCFVYSYEELQKLLRQMKTAERSSLCLTDRYGDYIQVGGYKDTFIVEVRRYIDAMAFLHMRADLKKEDSVPDRAVTINDWELRVPQSQILSQSQVCLLVQKFTEQMEQDDVDLYWKKLDFMGL